MKHPFLSEQSAAMVAIVTVIITALLLAGIIYSSFCGARARMRDNERIVSAREIAFALRRFEAKENSFRVKGTGRGGSGEGYALKSGGGEYTHAIVTTLKEKGYLSGQVPVDQKFGNENYFVTLCEDGHRFDVYLKLETEALAQAQNTISVGCGGIALSELGFNYRLGAYGGGFGSLNNRTIQ